MSVAFKEPLLLFSLFGICDLRLEPLYLTLEVANLRGRVHYLLQRGLLTERSRLLLQIAERRLFCKRDAALICRLKSHDDLEQGGLSRTVWPDESPALSRIQL